MSHVVYKFLNTSFTLNGLGWKRMAGNNYVIYTKAQSADIGSVESSINQDPIHKRSYLALCGVPTSDKES